LSRIFYTGLFSGINGPLEPVLKTLFPLVLPGSFSSPSCSPVLVPAPEATKVAPARGLPLPSRRIWGAGRVLSTRWAVGEPAGRWDGGVGSGGSERLQVAIDRG
jgi:hypothetical protein